MNLKTAFTLKRILLSLAIVILLLCIACVSVLLIKHHKKLDRFNKAKQAYLDEKYEDAKPLLRECLKDQYNDEEVNVMLAKIAENEDDWAQAAWHWQRVTKLNPFKPEYFDSYINSLMLTRDFRIVIDALDVRKTQNNITQEQYLLLAYSQYMQEGAAKAKETFANITDENVKKTDLAVILDFFLADSPHKIGEVLEFLKPYHDSADKIVAFESLYASAYRYFLIRDLENGRKCMAKVAELSPIIGKTMQAFYLYSFGLVSEAMTVFEECMQRKYIPNELGIALGECYVVTQQADKLAELRKHFMSGNSGRITTGLYLGALHDFLTNNQARLAQDIVKWKDNFTSPIATLVKLEVAANEDSLEDVKKYLTQILRTSSIKKAPEENKEKSQNQQDQTQQGNTPTTIYFDIQNYSFAIAYNYVINLVKKNQSLRAAEVAMILQKFDKPERLPNLPDPEKLLTQLVTEYKLAHGALTDDDINAILKKFPGDPLLLSFITRYYNGHGEFDKAIKVAQFNMNNLHELQKKQATEGKSVLDATPFAVNLLNALEANYIQTRQEAQKLEASGKTNEAKALRDKSQKQLEETKKAAKEVLAGKDVIAGNILYIDFCFRNRLRDDLEAYAADIKADDSDDTKALKYLARAQAAILPTTEEKTETAEEKQARLAKLTDAEKEKLEAEEKQKQEEDFAKKQLAVSNNLDNIVTAHPSILYKVALLYAAFRHFEKANATYQKILDQGQVKHNLYLNMSENYAAINQNEKALEYAQKALDLSPNVPIVREVYAIRLYEKRGEKELQQAYDYLDALVMAKTATDRGIYVWYILQQNRLAKLLETKDWAQIRTEAKHLQSIFPQDKQAAEALKKVDVLMKEEMQKDQEKAEEEK